MPTLSLTMLTVTMPSPRVRQDRPSPSPPLKHKRLKLVTLALLKSYVHKKELDKFYEPHRFRTFQEHWKKCFRRLFMILKKLIITCKFCIEAKISLGAYTTGVSNMKLNSIKSSKAMVTTNSIKEFKRMLEGNECSNAE
jgi:hypothetical protein